MILSEYPGHLIAFCIIVFIAAILAFAYRSEHLGGVKKWVPVLYVLRFSAIVVLLFIVWNPSRPKNTDQSVKNSVMVFFDTSESMSAGEMGKSNRLDESVKLFEKAFNPNDPEGPEYNIYGFDRHCYSVKNSDSLKKWGRKTNFHEVVSAINRHATGVISLRDDTAYHEIESGVVGAVVFSDGQADVKDPQAYLPLKKKNFPIAVIGIGSNSYQPDIAVSEFRAPGRVIIDTAYHVQAVITAKYIKDQSVTVELLKDDSPVSIKEITAEELKATNTVDFAVGADTIGGRTLTVRASIDSVELNAANNVRHCKVKVTRSEKIDVLLYSQVVTNYIGKVRQALVRDNKVELDFILDAIIPASLANRDKSKFGLKKLPENVEGFYKYDVIVLGACDLNSFSAKQVDGLYKFVTERGGGLVVLPGIERFGPQSWKNQKLQSLLPVTFASRKTSVFGPGTEAKMNLTYEGLDSRIITQDDLDKHGLKVRPHYNNLTKKPAGALLATAGDNPLLCSQRIGKGHVTLVNTMQLNQWYRADMDGGLLEEFMSSLTSHVLAAEDIVSTIKVFAHRPAESPDVVRFMARVYDATYSPVENAEVLVDIDGQIYKMVPAQKGYYRADITDIKAQSIVATVQAQRDGSFIGKEMTTFDLPVPKSEMDNIELDRKFLRGFAERVNGEYYDTYSVNNLSDMFEAKTEGEAFSHMVSIWPKWPLLLTLCGILSVCWFMRRTVGLV